MSLLSKFVSGVLLVNGFAMAGNGLLLGGGLNLSNVSFSEKLPPEVKKSMRTGFNVGAGIEVGVTPMFSIVPGVSLETRGLVTKVSDPDFGDIKTEVKLLYIEVPVLAQVNIPAGPGFLNIFAGPELGVLLTAKGEVSGDLEIDDEEFDMKDDTKSIDVGIHFGLGFEFPAGPGAILIRPGYSIGLTNIDDSESEPDPDFPEEEEPDVKVKNTNIKLSVAYKISL